MTEPKNCIDMKYNAPDRITITEASQHLCQVIREVQKTLRRKLITRNGKVIAAICSLNEIAIIDEIVEANPQTVKGDCND